MDTLRDLFESIVGTVRDRLGNPLLGAYVIAWSLWNFRVLLVLLGDGDKGWDAKVEYLDRVLLADWWTFPYYGLSVPLLVALIWIYAAPPVLRIFAVHHQQQLLTTKRKILEAQNDAPIPKAEALKLMARRRAAEERWEAERSALLRAVEDEREGREKAEAELKLSKGAQAPESPPEAEAVVPAKLENEHVPYTPEWRRSAEDRPSDIGVRVVSDTSIFDKAFSRAVVTCYGHAIEWPWKLTPEAIKRAGFRSGSTIIFDDSTVGTLLAIGESDRPVDIENIASALGYRAFEVRVAYDMLHSLGLVHDNQAINARGRLVVAWLLREGFGILPPQ